MSRHHGPQERHPMHSRGKNKGVAARDPAHRGRGAERPHAAEAAQQEEGGTVMWTLAFAAEMAARRLRQLLAVAAEALLSWVLHAALDDRGRPVMLVPPSAAPLACKPAALPRAPAPWCETTVIDVDLLTRIRPHVAASVPVRWLP